MPIKLETFANVLCKGSFWETATVNKCSPLQTAPEYKAAAAAPGHLGSAKITAPCPLSWDSPWLPSCERFWRLIHCLLPRFSPFILQCSQNMLKTAEGADVTLLHGLTALRSRFGLDPHTFCCSWWYHQLSLWDCAAMDVLCSSYSFWPGRLRLKPAGTWPETLTMLKTCYSYCG